MGGCGRDSDHWGEDIANITDLHMASLVDVAALLQRREISAVEKFDMTGAMTLGKLNMTEACFRVLEVVADLGTRIAALDAPSLADSSVHWLATCSVDALVGHEDLYPERAYEYGSVSHAPLDPVPNGFTPEGRPLCMQFVRARGAEAPRVRIAAAYERATD